MMTSFPNRLPTKLGCFATVKDISPLLPQSRNSTTTSDGKYTAQPGRLQEFRSQLASHGNQPRLRHPFYPHNLYLFVGKGDGVGGVVGEGEDRSTDSLSDE